VDVFCAEKDPGSLGYARDDTKKKERVRGRGQATMLSILSFMKMNFFGGLPSR
jgi:hypothetical protein